MLTAAKLVAALFFAGVGYLAAYFVMDTFPEGQTARFFPATVAAIGLWQGWAVMGSRAGDGMTSSMGNGLRTAVQIAFFGLAFFALREMFIRSADLQYQGAGEAVTASLNLFLEYFWQMQTVPVIVTLLVGGLLGGMVTEIASRRWR